MTAPAPESTVRQSGSRHIAVGQRWIGLHPSKRMLRHKHIPGCSGAKSRHVCHRPVQSRTRGAVEYSVKHCARKREFHDNGYRLRIRGRFASHLERRRSDHQLHQRNSAPTQHRSLGGIFISTPRYIPWPPRWKQQCPATTTSPCHSESPRSGGEEPAVLPPLPNR